MKRREIFGLIGCAMAWPVQLLAQKPIKVWRIGVLFGGNRQAATYAPLLTERLSDLGYREGENIVLDFRFDDGHPDRLPALAAELARDGKDVIVTGFDVETTAAKRATTRIPIVMLASLDPVGTGLVASLARPGGNVTGLTYEGGFEVSSKRIQLLKEAVPGLRKVGFFFNPGYPGMSGYQGVWRATSKSLGLDVQEFEAGGPKDFAAALPAIRAAGLGALFVAEGWHATAAERRQVVDFSIGARLPAMFVVPWDLESGGLMAYVPSDAGRVRRAAAFVDRILKGAKPADLPIEQPTHYELIINLKTARAIGLKIPQSVLLRADRVIE